MGSLSDTHIHCLATCTADPEQHYLVTRTKEPFGQSTLANHIQEQCWNLSHPAIVLVDSLTLLRLLQATLPRRLSTLQQHQLQAVFFSFSMGAHPPICTGLLPSYSDDTAYGDGSGRDEPGTVPALNSPCVISQPQVVSTTPVSTATFVRGGTAKGRHQRTPSTVYLRYASYRVRSLVGVSLLITLLALLCIHRHSLLRSLQGAVGSAIALSRLWRAQDYRSLLLSHCGDPPRNYYARHGVLQVDKSLPRDQRARFVPLDTIDDLLAANRIRENGSNISQDSISLIRDVRLGDGFDLLQAYLAAGELGRIRLTHQAEQQEPCRREA